MAQAGIHVPPFSCIATDAFEAALATHRGEFNAALARAAASAPDDLPQIAATVQNVVMRAIPPQQRVDELLAALDARFGADALVAVRSSMVSNDPRASEDSPSNPFAGLGDSYLYVRRDDVIDAIRRCWASPFKPEAMLYMRMRAIDMCALSVAIGIQHMVPGERSFVLFTCEPTTGARNPVVAAGLGIGEGVVQERVAVDHFFYDRAADRVEAQVVRKPTLLTQPVDDARELAELPVAPELQSQPTLTEAQVRQVVLIADRIEHLFGGAQDIEGTITADGTVHIVQARPVALDRRRRRMWSNANVTESFPGVTTALTYSFARWFYEADFGDLYRRLGVSHRDLRRHARELPGMIGFLNGRVYYSLSAWYALYRLHPLFAAYRRDWERMMGMPVVPEDRPDALRKPGGLHLCAALRLALPLARVARLVVGHERAMHGFDIWWKDVGEPRRGGDLTDLDAIELKAEFDSVWDEVVVRWGVTLINDLLITTTHGVVLSLIDRWMPAAPERLLTGLLCGGQEPRSVSAVMSAVALAERVRDKEALLKAFASTPPEELWQAIEHGRLGSELQAAFVQHLTSYGDRGLQELKMEQPNTRDVPWTLVSLVVGYAHSEITVEALRAREVEVRSEAEAELAARLGAHSPKRFVLRFLLERLRTYLRHREDSRYNRSELFGFAKRVFNALGRRLADQGVIADTSDVHHLTIEELFGYADGTSTLRDLGGLAALRRAEHEAAGPELPIQFSTLGPVYERLPTGRNRDVSDATELHGLGSSAGRVRGTAHVVIEPTEVAPMPEDAILIARETDPGWLFLMLRAKAMVVERGTLLSHTAITGRLFGIPTVVAVADATSAISHGAHVEVDGGTGLVRVLANGGEALEAVAR